MGENNKVPAPVAVSYVGYPMGAYRLGGETSNGGNGTMGFEWGDILGGLGGLGGGSTTGSSTGTSSGVGDWLGGVLGGLGGGSSTGTSSGGASAGGVGSLASLAGLAGPWGALAGSVLGMFSSIFQEGWSISCLGSQAFNNSDFDAQMKEAKAIVEPMNPNDILSIQNVLNQMSWRYNYYEKLTYRSSCSSALRDKFVKYCKGVSEKLLAVVTYTTNPQNSPHPDAGNYNWNMYNVTSITGTVSNNTGSSTGGNGGVTIPNGGITGGVTGIGGIGFNPNDYYDQAQGLMNSFDQLPSDVQTLLTAEASSKGMSLQDLLGAFASGQVTIKDGKIIWGVQAGNQPDQTMNYLIYAGVALLAYKFVIKK